MMDKIREDGLATKKEILKKINELVVDHDKIVKRLGDAMNIKDYYENDKCNFK